MELLQLANDILKELPVKDVKQAAKCFGVTHYYFTQKIKSIETDKRDLLRAVECLIMVANERSNRVQILHNEFLDKFKI